jgi:hypothetical protein
MSIHIPKDISPMRSNTSITREEFFSLGQLIGNCDVFDGFIFFTEANCYGKITKKQFLAEDGLVVG